MLDGYKTYLVAILTAAFGALAAADWNTILKDPKAGAAIVGMAVLMAVMRALTQITTVKKALDTVPPGVVVVPTETKTVVTKPVVKKK